MCGDLSGSRARADSRTNYGQTSPVSARHGRRKYIPESKCDNTTPVFLLHDHVPTRNGMESGVPPMRLSDSFAASRKTRARLLGHVLCLPRSEALICPVRCRMKLSSYVVQRRVGRVAQLRIQRLLGSLESEAHVRQKADGRGVAEVIERAGCFRGGVRAGVRGSYGHQRRGRGLG